MRREIKFEISFKKNLGYVIMFGFVDTLLNSLKIRGTPNSSFFLKAVLLKSIVEKFNILIVTLLI